jgi:hypothetical protein
LDLSQTPTPPTTLRDAKLKKQEEIIELAKVAQEELVWGYAPAEQASWDRKLTEAKAIIASNNIEDAPILKVEAIAFSGAQIEEDIFAATLFLAEEIINKSEQLYLASAQIAGRRTKLWNQVEAAGTLLEVQAISWE